MTTDEKVAELLVRVERLEKMMKRIFVAWASIRASTIQYLGNIEDFLGYERSITPRSKKENT